MACLDPSNESDPAPDGNGPGGSAQVPLDVVLARGTRAQLNGVLICTAMVLVIGLVTAAAFALAGAAAPALRAGASAALFAAAMALIAGAICALGMLQVLRTAASAHATVAVVRQTRSRLAPLPRIVLAGIILAIAAWSFHSPAGAAGALVGSAVAIQVPLVLMVLRRWLLDPDRLTGPPRPPLRRRFR